MSILPHLSACHILRGEPAAGDISHSKGRRDEFAADSGAADEKTDKRAQSTNRRQQQHDAVIAWHGKPTGGNLAVIIKALGVDQNRTQSAHDRCGYFVEFVDFKQDRRVAIKQSSLPYKKILVRRATH